MLMFARPIGEFVERHPTVKVLALSFLIMIGLVLMADGFGQHIPKGYIYAAMAFSVFVELINLWIRRRTNRQVAPVALHEKYAQGGAE
jgi:predicted tellurium resistance membrane protein TerC